ncbi:DUF1828 domain-containing protein [Sporosarcina aquimarina]|uniref:DUF1828 domain-containing protein n=1 Tax=Sporosarcina aquimarina TaxID=114975 RepID=UPI00203A63AF|nr:DUF1828 domain-containing protein [Sporosarcina aquimarina]MCM3756516.1 DUF1828 domain-containing protein [Sporosarcina aquimarina]
MKLEDFNDFIEITTPFVDMNHDHSLLYFSHKKDGTNKITDDRYILQELDMLGVKIDNAKKEMTFLIQP